MQVWYFSFLVYFRVFWIWIISSTNCIGRFWRYLFCIFLIVYIAQEKNINEFTKLRSFSLFSGLLLKLKSPTKNYKKYTKKQIWPIFTEYRYIHDNTNVLTFLLKLIKFSFLSIIMYIYAIMIDFIINPNIPCTVVNTPKNRCTWYFWYRMKMSKFIKKYE